MAPDSALGIPGPLGPTGPLSSWGPVGNAAWNPSGQISGGGGDWWSFWWKYFGDWVGWGQKQVIGPKGPLGARGPVNKDQIYQAMYHLLHDIYLANDFNHNLDIHGVWGALRCAQSCRFVWYADGRVVSLPGILGPLGPLGALGPLGPLGPVGAHNFTAGPDGQYRDGSGKIQRNLRAIWNDDSSIARVYDLYEFYSRDTASKLAEENDSSFMVEADVASADDVHTYRFKSQHKQTISVLVIPIIQNISDTSAHFGDFNLAVSLAKGSKAKEFAVSALESSHSLPPTSQKGFVDYAIFRAGVGNVYEVKVWARLTAKSQKRYRLFVTGSGFHQGAPNQEKDADLFNHMNFEGPYIHS